MSYFGYEYFKEFKAEPGRVKIAEKIFQEQLVESIPIAKLLCMKYKTKFGSIAGGSGGDDGRISINEESKNLVLTKLERLLTQQLAEGLCKKNNYSYERYRKWFEDPKNE